MCACLWEILSIGYDASKGKECFFFFFSSCFLPCFPCLKKKKNLWKMKFCLKLKTVTFCLLYMGNGESMYIYNYFWGQSQMAVDTPIHHQNLIIKRLSILELLLLYWLNLVCRTSSLFFFILSLIILYLYQSM